MEFQDTPTAFNRIVLAVIRGIVQSVDGFTNLVRQRHQPVEELGPYPIAFRAVIHFDLNEFSTLLFWRTEPVPPRLQGIHDEIAGFIGTAKGNVQLAGILVHDAAGNILCLAPQVGISGFILAACLSATGKITQLDRGFAVQTQPVDRVGLGMSIFLLDLGENDIGFRNFFCGLALTTLRNR